ncbi:THUMP domain-containing class I SAM-dependent RNA methyltransferase [Bdellovibrio sp. HCB2-146]|uniref:THUMP domain-containing class I SAM-dependent RNA methyltransferase n=1 Tax=Bdellovibrio sp. HCB2-146 TaxID=3394362 RepID=UPI0039BCE5C0
MNTFFISTPIGFEEQTLKDMKAVWPYLLAKNAQKHDLPFPEVFIDLGGLEFQADMFTGVQLNFFLKTANRILFRMAAFKARDLPKFYQKMRSLPWIDFLQHGNVAFEVAAQKSRLNNEKRLEESARQALDEIFKGAKGPKPCAKIYIRMDDDNCTISLDTTGEHLHKRGWSVLKGEAPLRETLAAGLIKSMIENEAAEDLAKITLYDPMMGAGTFLTEGRALFAGQFQRPYAFQEWKRAPKLFLSNSFALNYQMPTQIPFAGFKGRDVNPEMLSVVKENFAEVEKQLAGYQKKSFAAADLDVAISDSLKELEPASGPSWMVVNPPYGERLEKAGSGIKINDLAERFCKFGKPQKLGILFPEKYPLTVAPMGYKVAKEIKINNGGIRCLWTVLSAL